MKKIIIAYPVQDLTVARYLAARNLDYIGIDLDSRDVVQNEYFINQLRNWIEGPKLIGFTEHLGTLHNQSYSILDDIFIKPSFLISGPNQIDLVDHEENPFIFRKTKEQFDQLSDVQKKVAIVLVKDAYHLHEINGNLGWMVDPGHEEITGICDFDALDALLDDLN